MYLEIKNKKIFYTIRESEKSKALIFIHGSGGSSYTWKNQLNLDIDFDIVALDLPSHDKSDNFSELSLSLYVDLVHQLIKSLNYKSVILCGHSLGGAIIQQYYFTYPKDVLGLILCSTGGRLRVAPFILDSLKNNYSKFLEDLPAGAFYRATPKETIEHYIQESSKISAEVTYSDFKICDNFDVLSKLDTIEVPCLIIVGKQDQLTPVKYSEFSHNKIKSSEHHIINKAGHMVMLEKPNEVNQAIENFIINYF
ncbi:MAG: alpha/beta hydrolase [Candidatus Lokiarchaeota archaeon]|nr:alpha/beta hydrolase [Candidatus Lokiarchaeota archaeon]